jgi:ferritin heavy chain
MEVPWKLSKYPDYQVVDENLKFSLSKQVNAELHAFYTYASMASYFDRDYVALHGFHAFFQKAAEEELSHATKIMQYMNKRGVPVLFANISVPCEHTLLTSENTVAYRPITECDGVDVKMVRKRERAEPTLINCDWRDPLTAVTIARQLEINVYRSIRSIVLQADKHRDPSLTNFLDEFLEEQVDSIKELSDMIAQLKRVEPCMGYYMVDKDLMEKVKK